MVLSYAKISLNQQLIQSDVPEDPYLGRELDRYFPDRIDKPYEKLLAEHRLKREIIATATTNSIVNRMGPTFVSRTRQDTGANAAAVARAYTIAREIYEARDLWRAVEALDNRVVAETQYDAMQETVRLLRQTTYWLLQRHPTQLGIERQVRRLGPGIAAFTKSAHGWLLGTERENFTARATALAAANVPADLSRRLALGKALQCAPDIVELAQAAHLSIEDTARAYFTVGSGLGLDWLRGRVEALDVAGQWHAVARMSLREALYESHRELTHRVLAETREKTPSAAFDKWQRAHASELAHLQGVVNDLRAQPATIDFASLSVALQAARRLTATQGTTS
jgi:glutamate dehydrogenase